MRWCPQVVVSDLVKMRSNLSAMILALVEQHDVPLRVMSNDLQHDIELLGGRSDFGFGRTADADEIANDRRNDRDLREPPPLPA